MNKREHAEVFTNVKEKPVQKQYKNKTKFKNKIEEKCVPFSQFGAKEKMLLTASKSGIPKCNVISKVSHVNLRFGIG